MQDLYEGFWEKNEKIPYISKFQQNELKICQKWTIINQKR